MIDLSKVPGMKKPRNVVGVSIESSRLAMALMHRHNGHSEVTATCALPLTPEQLLANPEQAGRDLAACLQQAGIREKRCAVCLPPAWALTASVQVPAIPPEDLPNYLDLQAEREFPIPPGDLHLAHSRYQLNGGLEMATLAAIPATRLDGVRRFLAAAGCRAVSISLGIDACLPDHGAAGSLNFIANGSHVDVVICAGGGVVDLRSLNGSPVPEADAPTLDPTSLQRELRITLGRLPPDLLAQIRQGRFLGRVPSARALRTAVEAPLRDLGIERMEGGDAGAPADDPENGAGMAAATKHLYGRPATFEFVLPTTTRFQILLKKLSSRRNRIATLAAPVLVGLAALILLGRSHYENRLDRRWADMEATATELASLQDRVRQFRPWFSAAPESLYLLQGLTEAFPETGEVWARRVEWVGNREVTCTGMARNHADLMAMLDRLGERAEVSDVQVQQVRGETPLQFAFTYTWRRNSRD